MAKDTPTQQTLILIISWILGSLCLLLSILFISYGYIAAAFFMFLAAVMGLPPTANVVMSKVNYSLSDTRRFFIAFVLTMLSNAALPFWGAP